MLRTIRPAVAADAPFLEQMLALAFNWCPGVPPVGRDLLMARPEIAHYIEGWPREDDAGCVAEDETGAPTGAAWWRHLAKADAGYGYVADHIPELSIGVMGTERGQGVGAALLQSLIETARGKGLTALSLSVEPENNRAHNLYRRLGFAVVGRVGNADTMVLDLAMRHDRHEFPTIP
jgi:ribosomal protein S18 acetylase RimI-like enzyme